MAKKTVQTDEPLRFTDLSTDAQNRAFYACESSLRAAAVGRFRRRVERDIPSLLQAFNLVAEGSKPPYFAPPHVVCDEDFGRSRAYAVRGVWVADGYDLAKVARAIDSTYENPESIAEMLSIAVRLHDFARSASLSSKEVDPLPISVSTREDRVRVLVGKSVEQIVNGNLDGAGPLVRRLLFAVAESAGEEYFRLTSREALWDAMEDLDTRFRENGEAIDEDELDDERSAGVER